MTVICLGPCCIPVSALYPLVFLLLAPFLGLLRKTPLAKYLPDPKAPKKSTKASAKDCCSDNNCQDGGVGGSKDAGNVKAVTSMEHFEELKRSEPLLVVDFTAGWCKPCKTMAPIFEGLAAEHKGAATFAKVDIDDLPDAFDGVSIPAFHVLKGGAKLESMSGAGEERLRSMVEKHCKKAN